MKNKKLIILVVLLLIGLFYWFEIRPVKIRMMCGKAYGGLGYTDSSMNLYELCTHRNGLK